MDAVPIVPPLFWGTKTRHFTSYKQATDHALLTGAGGAVGVTAAPALLLLLFGQAQAERHGRSVHPWGAEHIDMRQRPDRYLRAVGAWNLAQDRLHVDLDSRLGDSECACDGLVGLAFEQAVNDLSFAFGKRRNRRRGRQLTTARGRDGLLARNTVCMVGAWFDIRNG